jgi:hypothetical protein
VEHLEALGRDDEADNEEAGAVETAQQAGLHEH